jgi:hypothetical protein
MVLAILCSTIIAVGASISYSRIVDSAKYAAEIAFTTAKYAAISVTFICLGIVMVSYIGLFMYFSPSRNS